MEVTIPLSNGEEPRRAPRQISHPRGGALKASVDGRSPSRVGIAKNGGSTSTPSTSRICFRSGLDLIQPTAPPCFCKSRIEASPPVNYRSELKAGRRRDAVNRNRSKGSAAAWPPYRRAELEADESSTFPRQYGYETRRGIRLPRIDQKDIWRPDAGVLEPDDRMHTDELGRHMTVLANLRPIDFGMQQFSDQGVASSLAGENRQSTNLRFGQHQLGLRAIQAVHDAISPDVATFLRAKLEVIRATPGRRDKTVEWRASYALVSSLATLST